MQHPEYIKRGDGSTMRRGLKFSRGLMFSLDQRLLCPREWTSEVLHFCWEHEALEIDI